MLEPPGDSVLRIARWLLAAFVVAATASLGYLVGAKNQFPFVRWDRQYSIAVYEGDTPFVLSPAPGSPVPAFTGRDVPGRPAYLVADPFVLSTDDTQYLFFEVVDERTQRGEIGWAESHDGLHWTYAGIALQEPFHLSYPQVFRSNGSFFMIPESSQDYSVSLYKAEEFPRRWRKVKTLLRGNYTDSSVVEFEGRWWMFANDSPNALRLFMADRLEGPWVEHPKSPIVIRNVHLSRCGGRILVDGGKIYRFAQDGEPRYGSALWALEVVTMTPQDYEERVVGNAPILQASGQGWNADGMHQIDHVKVGARWRAYVDGSATRLTFSRWWRKIRP